MSKKKVGGITLPGKVIFYLTHLLDRRAVNDRLRAEDNQRVPSVVPQHFWYWTARETLAGSGAEDPPRELLRTDCRSSDPES